MNQEQALFLGSGDAVPMEWLPKRDGITPISQRENIGKNLRYRLRARRNTRVLAFLADLLALLAAFLGAGLVRFGEPLHGNALNTLGAILPVYFIVAINNRCFHLDAVARARVGAWNAIMAFLVTLSVVGLVAFFLRVNAEFSRAVLGTGSVAALVLLPTFRFAAVRAGRILFGGATTSDIVIEDGVSIGPSDAIVIDAQRLGLEPRVGRSGYARSARPLHRRRRPGGCRLSAGAARALGDRAEGRRRACRSDCCRSRPSRRDRDFQL